MTYFCIEGPEYSGKTTQAGLLRDRLESLGVKCLLTKEPGSVDPSCQRIRSLLLSPESQLHPDAAFLLFQADRVQHLEQLVKPFLTTGGVVIQDRSALSSIVYAEAERTKANTLDHLAILAFAQRLPADLTFITSVDLDYSLERLQGKAKLLPDRIEAKPKDFHARVHAGFRTLVDGLLNKQFWFPKRVVFLPSTETLSKESLHELIFREVEPYLKPRSDL